VEQFESRFIDVIERMGLAVIRHPCKDAIGIEARITFGENSRGGEIA
jgi:hypothetical protein